MIWKTIQELNPEYKKKVLIFRAQREKYTIGSMHAPHPNCEEDDKKDYWVTEHGSCHTVLPDDAWMEFPYYATSKEYK